jgi:hypothetical protein
MQAPGLAPTGCRKAMPTGRAGTVKEKYSARKPAQTTGNYGLTATEIRNVISITFRLQPALVTAPLGQSRLALVQLVESVEGPAPDFGVLGLGGV